MIHPARHDHDRIRHHQLPRLLPPQHRTPREVAARLDRHERRPAILIPVIARGGTEQERESLPRPQDLSFRITPPHDPLLVLAGEVHLAAKRLGPVQTRGEVVRVGDDDGINPAEAVDPGDGLVVDVGEAVPEDVAAGGAAEEGALADGQFGDGVDAHEEEVLVGEFVDDEFVAVLL